MRKKPRDAQRVTRQRRMKTKPPERWLKWWKVRARVRKYDTEGVGRARARKA